MRIIAVRATSTPSGAHRAPQRDARWSDASGRHREPLRPEPGGSLNDAAVGVDLLPEQEDFEGSDRPGGCDEGTPAGTGNRQVSAWSLPPSSRPPLRFSVWLGVYGLVNDSGPLFVGTVNFGCKFSVISQMGQLTLARGILVSDFSSGRVVIWAVLSL